MKYLDMARIADLVKMTTSSDDVEVSKPAPDIFEVVLRKLGIEGADPVAIGDTPTMRKPQAGIAISAYAAVGLRRPHFGGRMC